MQDWIFFGANLAFTAFNAWFAWEAWKRQRAADLPTAAVQMHWSAEHQVWQLEATITNPTRALWRCLSATLHRPRKPLLYYPLTMMMPHPGSGEPWVPAPIKLTAAEGRSSVKLAAMAFALGDCREVLWLKDVSGEVALSIEIESTDAQPRRHTIHVKRKIPAFTPVIAS